MLLVAIRELKAVRVSYPFSNFVGTLVLVTQLLTRSVTCPVLCRNPYLISFRKVDGPTVLVGLYPLLLLRLCHGSSTPLPDLVNSLDMCLGVLSSLTDMF